MNPPENSPSRTRWRALIDRHLLGELSAEEGHELEASLAARREAREDFRLRCNVDAALRTEAEALVEDCEPGAIAPSRREKVTTGRFHWVSWRPWPAAAAGLAFGILSATIVWAYALPGAKRPAERVIPVLAEGFENADLPPARGFPKVANEWSGDLSVPVPADAEVAPVEGIRMMRLTPPNRRKFSYAWRIVDVHEFPVLQIGETCRLEVSAAFNAPGPGRPLRYQVRLAAFSQEPEAIRKIWNDEPMLFDTVLQHVGRNLLPPADARGWQTVGATMEIPPGTRSIVISLGATEADAVGEPKTYYLDDVRVRFVSAQARPE